MRSVFSSLLLLVALSACTAGRPPAYNLPEANALVAGETYTVGRNENIYAIAQKQGVKMRDIIALNDLKPPFALYTGQKLTLPNKDRFAAPTPKSAPLDYIDKGPLGPSSTTIKGSWTEGGSPSTSSDDVTAVPLAPPPQTTYANTPAKAATDTTPSKTLPEASAVIGSSEAKPTEATATQAAAAPAPAPAAAPAQSTATSTGLTNTPPEFGWPVRGTIISAYGPKGKGLDNDGINIAAPKGSPVKAAAGGIVAYSGNEMKGFGNLVLIRHEGGWVTAYAHLERLVVARDAVVAKGDMIGTVGTSGGVSSPQLHFEARREGKPVDPELVIK